MYGLWKVHKASEGIVRHFVGLEYFYLQTLKIFSANCKTFDN